MGGQAAGGEDDISSTGNRGDGGETGELFVGFFPEELQGLEDGGFDVFFLLVGEVSFSGEADGPEEGEMERGLVVGLGDAHAGGGLG